jgi:hypothetical protein
MGYSRERKHIEIDLDKHYYQILCWMAERARLKEQDLFYNLDLEIKIHQELLVQLQFYINHEQIGLSEIVSLIEDECLEIEKVIVSCDDEMKLENYIEQIGITKILEIIQEEFPDLDDEMIESTSDE